MDIYFLYRKTLFCQAWKQMVMRELSRIRGYGCVTLFTNGSHTDMDASVFFASAAAISSTLQKIEKKDLRDFPSLRSFGKIIEKEMFLATGGINTHKGLIFLSLFLYEAWLSSVSFNDLADHISSFADGLEKDYEHPVNSARLHFSGLKDIRHYPLTGFSELLAFISEMNGEAWSEDRKTLYLLSVTDDTTTVKRGSIELMKKLKEEARAVFLSKSETDALRLDRFYRDHKLSSGGVADLLTVTNLILYLWRTP